MIEREREREREYKRIRQSNEKETIKKKQDYSFVGYYRTFPMTFKVDFVILSVSC